MQWYVVHTKPRQEQRALKNLQNQGFQAWLPLMEVEKLRLGRMAKVVEPLFSRYLFIRLDTTQSNWSPIRYTLGVSKLVSFGNVPAAVPDEFIEVLQRSPQRAPQLMLNPGDEVAFIDGPLRGLQGIFQQRDGEVRAMVLIELLSQPHTIATALKHLRPVAA